MSINTDLYTFMRIFRPFSDTKMRRVNGCQGDNYQQKNIIMYGGDNHIKAVSYLIENVFEIEKTNQWTDVTDENKLYKTTIPEPIQFF